MRSIRSRLALILALVPCIAGCATCPQCGPRGGGWRQVYATSSHDGAETLFLWDFTDPDRPVVREFSFQPRTYRSWIEYEFPSEPGTVWRGEEEGKRLKVE